MPSPIKQNRLRTKKMRETLIEIRNGNSVLDTLARHRLRLLDILHHKNVSERDKQRIVTQLKLEGELK
jgi:hypothetical protein